MKSLSALGTVGAVALFCAVPVSLQWSPAKTPSLSLNTADARIGRPVTPMSFAGVHRRAMRRTYGVGANLGYHPVARAGAVGAVHVGATAYGAGYYGADYGGGYGYGYGAPLYSSAAPAWGGGWGAWNNPWWNNPWRPLYSSAACIGPFCGAGWAWGGGWGAPGWGGGWGWRQW